MTQRLTARTALLLTLPPLLWAGNAVVGRLMVGEIPPITFNLLRWVAGFALLLPLAAWVLRRDSPLWPHWGRMALLGLLGMGSYNALQYMALRTSTPLNVTLIASSSPVWAMVVGALGYKVIPTRLQLIGAVLSLAGVALVMSRGNPAALADIQFVQGDLLMLLAIIGWSIYSWMLARPPAHMTGAARPAWNWAQFLVAQCVFGVVWAVGAAGAGDLIAPSAPTQWSWQLVAAIVFIAIGPSIIAYRLWGLAVAEAGPAMASIFYNLTPLFAAVLSAAVIGESPQPFHGVAFALIVAGIMVSSRTTAKKIT